jgi:hypothetical protein
LILRYSNKKKPYIQVGCNIFFGIK